MWERHSEMAAKQTSEKTKRKRVFGQRRKHLKTFRVGLYARVSTFDQHTIPLQIRALREYAAQRGWTIALQVKEIGSGAAQRLLREELLDAARRREIDVVLVWRLDRWGRCGPWPHYWLCSPSSNVRFCASGCAPDWLTHSRTVNGWAGR
jgi:predicted site-specific integrase-resolvase